MIPFEGALEDAQYLAVVDIPTSCNLGLMLRDAEGEGHLDWRPTAQSRRHMFTQKEGQWDDGKDIVEFIQQTIDGVMKHLFPIEKEAVVEDEEFSHTIRTLVKTETEEGEDEEEEEEDPDPCDDCGSIPCICIIPPPPGKEKVASIKARPDSGEVRVLRNPRLALAGEKVKINTAIMNNRANSFTRYREFDFTPDDISCNLKGCELISVDYNKAPKKRGGVAITISIDDDDWRADISGFPIDRDIDTFTGLVQ